MRTQRGAEPIVETAGAAEAQRELQVPTDALPATLPTGAGLPREFAPVFLALPYPVRKWLAG